MDEQARQDELTGHKEAYKQLGLVGLLNEKHAGQLEEKAYSVSRATLRIEDLVVAFYQELARLDAEAAHKLVTGGEYEDVLRECDELSQVVCGDWSSGKACENACWLFWELVDALQEQAPEGLYFGVLEGDSSDFGFHVAQEEYLTEED